MIKLDRRNFMRRVGLAAGAMALGKHASAQKRPNIVFMFADDHGRQAISAYGSNRNQTPNIDRIANEGMRFDNCLVTNSICGPCRAVILTGKHSHINGFVRNGNRFDGSQQTFPKLLQKAGYQTAIFGKWHLGSLPTGFDDYEVLKGQGPYYNPPMIRNGEDVEHTGYTTDIIGDLTLDWLKNKRDPDKPFMLMSQHKAPHRNWQPGPKYLTKYDGETIPEPATLFDDYAGRGQASKENAMSIEYSLTANDLKLTQPRGLTEEQLKTWNAAYGPKNKAFEEAKLEGVELIKWKYQRYAKDYLRSIDSVDDNVGRILDYLDEAGLVENTVVIYSSDQGWFLGEHGWFDKRWMYEESLQTPLVARWPGVIKPGSTVAAMTSNLDFAETFLEIAGVDVPDDMQGASIVPLMRGETPADWRTSFYYQYWEYPGHRVQPHYGVRTERYKLIRFPWIDEWELYDLEKDPDEMQNAYGDPAFAEITETLKKELDRLRREFKAPERNDVYPDGTEYRVKPDDPDRPLPPGVVIN